MLQYDRAIWLVKDFMAHSFNIGENVSVCGKMKCGKSQRWLHTKNGIKSINEARRVISAQEYTFCPECETLRLEVDPNEMS